jgi:Resolvase, N terminal domain
MPSVKLAKRSSKAKPGEGWRLIKNAYNDGGISGGTMERPALQQLLADIRQKRVDVVVVYKVDSLTRSLADFAKMVEVFDQHGVSFVAVTQQFNTTSSMGRLTLNVLLSFAQFEREVTGERIRDKITASKKKGMWMGGTVPIGYDAIDRHLVVNPAEATLWRAFAPPSHFSSRRATSACCRQRLEARRAASALERAVADHCRSSPAERLTTGTGKHCP